jgi:hypothetical protein
MIDPAELDDIAVIVVVLAAIVYAVATLAWVFGVSVSAFAWARHRGMPAHRAVLLAGSAAAVVPLVWWWAFSDDGSGTDFAIYLVAGLAVGLVGVVTLGVTVHRRRRPPVAPRE